MRRTLFLAVLAFVAQAAPAQNSADRQRLAEELQAEVREFRATLPMREGVLTITRVDLLGTEVIYAGVLDADFDDAAIAEFRRVLSIELCRGETRDMIRRGGAFTYDLQDQGGERFETTVSRCD